MQMIYELQQVYLLENRAFIHTILCYAAADRVPSVGWTQYSLWLFD